MSRHRYVRNLDLVEELISDPPSSDDGADVGVSPEHYPDITPTQRVQLDSGLAHVRSVIGKDGFSDRQIREALWDSYFDVEGTIEWLLQQRETEEKEKKEKAKFKQKADPTPSISELSALQRLSIANHENQKAKGKISLASLARKKTEASASTISQSPGSLSPLPRTLSINLSAPQGFLHSPTASVPRPSKISLLSPKSSTSDDAVSHITTAKPSKIALKLQKVRSAASGASSKNSAGGLPSSTEEFFSPNGAPIDKPTIMFPQPTLPKVAEPTPSSPPSLDSVFRSASASGFASLLVQRWHPPAAQGGTIGSDGIRGKQEKAFSFDTPSPDDIVLSKRVGTRLGRERGSGGT